MSNLSSKILNLRKQNGLSQEELAERLGVSRQAVSRWEAGSTQPDASNLLQLSKLFRVTADYLLNDDYESDHAPSAGKSAANSAKAKTKKLLAAAAAAFGAFGVFVLYLLSRFIEVMVPYITYQNGEKLYTWRSDLTGHSYRYFIQEYDLELLAALLYGLLLVGVACMLWENQRVRNGLLKCREKLRFAKRK
nr:helix-turn-helix transcriptional regulator [Fournierella massiliensis]